LISIVCVYNNEIILNKYLIKSLHNANSEYELILVDNTENKFKSASEALNFGGNKAKGDYIAFIHQDIKFDSPNFLEKLEAMLDKLDDLGIAGMAGVSEDIKGVISNIVQGESSELVGKNKIEKPLEVQTLDECLVMIPKSVFESLKFDEETCDDWHLYGVDYSLSVRELRLSAYVLPMYIYHRSPGYSMSEGYDITMKKLLKKHKDNYKWIYTTLGNYNTHLPLSLQKNVKKILIPVIKALNLWKY
jgi:glycosyltransferase involved in cell wall biosynthesis